jgi:hypothetical protein
VGDEDETVDAELRDVEAELCRLPDVLAARIVADDLGRPIEVHVLAQTGKHPKQIVRDIQSVALASFGIDIDRRIVSVVQLGPDGSDVAPGLSAPARPRTRIQRMESQASGARVTIRVTLARGDEEATGFAEGSIATATRPRIVALATLDALRQLDPAAAVLDVDTARVLTMGSDDIVLVTLVAVAPYEHRLLGSAIVRGQIDECAVRAALDATNRRLEYLAQRSDHDSD